MTTRLPGGASACAVIVGMSASPGHACHCWSVVPTPSIRRSCGWTGICISEWPGMVLGASDDAAQAGLVAFGMALAQEYRQVSCQAGESGIAAQGTGAQCTCGQLQYQRGSVFRHQAQAQRQLGRIALRMQIDLGCAFAQQGSGGAQHAIDLSQLRQAHGVGGCMPGSRMQMAGDRAGGAIPGGCDAGSAVPEAWPCQIGAGLAYGEGACARNFHVDAGAGCHADCLPAFVGDVYACLPQYYAGQASLVLLIPATDKRVGEPAGTRTPGFASIQQVMSILRLAQPEPRARHFRAPDAPAAASWRAGACTIEFGQDGQRIGMGFIQFEQAQVDSSDGRQRLPALQGGAMSGPGQRAEASIEQIPQAFHGWQGLQDFRVKAGDSQYG